MAYRVELMPRAGQNLRRIYSYINAENSPQARAWFDGLEAFIFSLKDYPSRGTLAPESQHLRQLFYGSKPHIYRIVYTIDERRQLVNVLHIRHGARDADAS